MIQVKCEEHTSEWRCFLMALIKIKKIYRIMLNQIFEQLSKKNDIIYMISNDNHIDFTVDNISNIIDSKIKIRKR